MTETDRVYSVLLVSAQQTVNDTLKALLQAAFPARIRTAASVSAARRAFAEQAFDMVVVNSPLPDDVGTRFAVDAAAVGGTVVLLLIRAELLDEISDRVSPRGVFSLPKPSSRTLLQTALCWLVSARERLRSTEKKTLTLEEKMQEIRLVNRAKWLLIERYGMDEQTAHRTIEKQAMDRCLTRRAVAEELLRDEGLLPPGAGR